ncbi:glycerophosphodiester phosphodiesterase [Bacillus alkalicellulosilyticus]|uniref:glycerophosphodiester phosphodiesterase n=1 Tax=Alkalihalobacterium alkalicellulosilyticum TaxID=1912214 RepID=UPI0009978613|nr:glycerophosphodiester phosphodiesterase family protein [Bacillus alkalicellulosilyticus]
MTKIFAHRGFSSAFPENTMAAFKAAEKLGVDGLELDVQLTKDNIPVIIHDDKLNRTTSGSGYVRDTKYANVKQLSAGQWFGEQFANETVPSLREFIEWVSDTNLTVNLELKGQAKERIVLLEAVMKEVLDFKIESNVILSSFDHQVIVEAKQRYPFMKVGVIVVAHLVYPEKYISSLGFDCDYHFYHHLMTVEEVQSVVEKGIKVRPYTVNNEQKVREMIKIGVDGIFTDHPDMALSILSE